MRLNTIIVLNLLMFTMSLITDNALSS